MEDADSLALPEAAMIDGNATEDAVLGQDPDPGRGFFHNPAIRWSLYTLLAAVVFYFTGKSLLHSLRQIDWKDVRFRGWPVAAALGCLMVMRLLNAVSCRTLLLSMGYRVGLRWTTGAIWVSSLGRYVPSKMVAGLGAALMMTRRGVELPTALAVMFLYTAIMVLIAVMFAAPLALMPQMRHLLPGAWVISLAMIAAGLVALHPRNFAALCNLALRWLKRGQLLSTPNSTPYFGAVLVLVLRALFMGLCTWFAIHAFAPITLKDYPMALAGTAMASVIGFLAVFVPAGLGVQEWVFLIVFGPLLKQEAALLALLYRVLQTLADAIAGALGLVILHPRFAGTRRAVRVGPLPVEARGFDVLPSPAAADGAIRATIKPIPRLLLEMPHKPDFFIVGAAKCGTTSLYEYLRQHPGIFMSPHKEPHYFARDFDIPPEWCVREDERYVQLFSRAGSAKRVGEASVWYVYSQVAAQELKVFSPNARIIVMLRHPIDMMYSLHGQFLWNCNDDILDFQEALAAQADRSRGLRIPPEAHMPAALQYQLVASFSAQVRRYYDAFGPERVHVILFDDFLNDTAAEYRKVLEFLEVDAEFAPDFRISNPAKPITPRLNRFMARRPKLRQALHTLVPSRIIRRLNYALPYVVQSVARPGRIDPRLRQQLVPQFAEEIDALEKLIGRNLSAWKR